MVIQRIQNLCLLLALIVMILFLFVPFGYLEADGSLTALKAAQMPGLLIASIATMILLVVSIMMFRMLTPQRRMVALSMIATCAEIVTVVLLLVSDVATELENARTVWGGGGLMLVAALIAEAVAYRAIGRDRKLLSSYDRLR